MTFAPGQGYRDWKSWEEADFGRFDSLDAAYFANELRRGGMGPLDGARILELGFGNGKFAGWAASKGASYSGTELDEASLQVARQKGFAAFPATLNLEEIALGKPFDFIFAFDVLEHLTLGEIAAILSSAAQCLSVNGRMLVRFPSGDSPFSRAIQYGDMTHRTVIGSGIIEQLANDASLDVLQARSPAFPLAGVGFRRLFRRLPVLALRGIVAAIVNVAFNDNQPRVMTSNMVVVLCRRGGERTGNL